MARIQITGKREPIETDYDKAKKIKESWIAYKQNKKDAVVEIEEWNGTLSLIRSVDLNAYDQRNASESKRSEEYHKEYLLGLTGARNETPEIRAKRFGFFRVIYRGFTGQDSRDIKIGEAPLESLVEKIQKKFFEENPKRVFCDPTLFHPLIKSKKCDGMVMRIIENQIRQDRFAEKYL